MADDTTVLNGNTTELSGILDYIISQEKKFGYKGLSINEVKWTYCPFDVGLYFG